MGWRETLESLYKNRDWHAATVEERQRAITDVIQISAFGSAAVNVTPVPLADLVVALPLQGAMVVAIGHIKGRDISKEQSLKIARELSTVVGTHLLARQAFITLSRLLFPGMAGFLMAPWAFGVTYGMGRVAELYFEDPNAPGEALKERFKEGLKDARSVFSKDAFMDFMNRRGQDAKDFAESEKAPEATQEQPAQPAEPPKVVEAEWEEESPKKNSPS
ncbi:MAG: DUF697 domain-containing protein [Myxococcota bacterium]